MTEQYKTPENLAYFENLFRHTVAKYLKATSDKNNPFKNLEIAELVLQMAEILADYHLLYVNKGGLGTVMPQFVLESLTLMHPDLNERLKVTNQLYVMVCNILAQKLDHTEKQAQIEKGTEEIQNSIKLKIN